MSSIDRRVVELEFDNKQFGEGVAETLKMIEDLNKGLKLDGASKGLGDLSDAASKFNLDSMAAGIDNISGKFSALGAIGFTIIQNLTNSAIDFGKKMAGMVLDPLVGGGRRRALNIEQAKFMFRGLSMDIEEAMANALYAVQGTAFGLDEAARAASQLGASQVELGDDMRQALRGISGVAAMTNSSYEDTARVFTRVAGQGRVMAVDLNSLAARGLNAAATLAEAFGKTEAEIREMVTKGEISFDMFAQAMDEAFGENATKANETYTGSLANLRAALSRIGAGFFTPFLEQQRDLFNALTPAIDAVGEALKPVISQLTHFTGRATTGMIRSLNSFDFSRLRLVFTPLMGIMKNLYQTAKSVLGPIREAFRQIFPPASLEQINSILKAIQKFTAGLKMGEEGAENLRRTFAGVFALFSIGWSVVKAVAIFLADLFGMVSDGSGGFLDATANVGDFLVALDQAIKNGEGLTNFFKGLQGVLTKPLEFLKEIGKAVHSLFDFDAPSAERLSLAFEPLGQMGEWILGVWSHLGDALRRVGEIFAPFASKVKTIFGDIGRAIAMVFEGVEFDEIISTIQTTLLGGVLLTFRRLAKNLGSGFGSGIHRLTQPFGMLTITLRNMQATLRAMTLMQIAVAIGILAASVHVLSKIDAAGLTRSLTAISAMFVQLFAAMAVFTKIGGVKGLFTIGAGLTVFAIALRILTSSVKALAELEWDELSRGLAGVAGLIAGLTVATRLMAGQSAGMITAGTGLLILSTGIRVLVTAVTDLSGLSWEDMARGLVGVGALLTSLAIFTRLVAANKAGILQGAGLVLLAAGIKILASAVGDFAAMSWENIGKGLAAVAGILTAFAIFSRGVGNPVRLMAASASLILVGAAMNILAAAAGKFARLSWQDLAKGMAAMAGSLTAIVIALNLMPPSTLISAAALVAVSVALGLLADAMGKMGGMSWEEIGKGLVVLGGSMLIIAVAMAAMTGALPGAAATFVVSGALVMLAGALKVMGGMSWAEIGRGLATLAGAFVILGLAGLVLGPVVPALMGLGIAITMIGAGMALAGIGVAAFAAGLTVLAVAGAAGTAALVAMISALAGLLPMIAEMLGEAVVVFAVTITNAAPALVDAMVALLDAIVEAVTKSLPGIVELFITMTEEVLAALKALVPVMADAALSIMLGILDAMNAYVPTIVTAIGNLIVGILDAMAEGIPGIVTAATNLMVEFLGGIEANIDRVVTAGTDILIALINGVSENMARLADEGLAAVVSFINGVAEAIRNNTGDLQAAGRNLASAIVEGLTGGLSSSISIGKVTRAAGALARSALNAAKNVLDVSSPSKEFEKIGEWTAEGFAEGLVSGSEGVTASWQMTMDLLQSANESAVEDIAKLEDKLEKLHGAKTRDVEAIQETERALAQARLERDRTSSTMTLMNEKLTEEHAELNKLAKEYDFYIHQLERAEERRKEAIKTRDDYKNMIQDQYDNLPSIGKDTDIKDYMGQIRNANADIEKFNEVLASLRKKGLSDDMYKELLAAGPDALFLAEQLNAGGTEAVKEVNKLSSQLAKNASKLGKNASQSLYQAGVDSANGWVNGLTSKKKKIEKEMTELATAIVAAIKKTLGIKSPSVVMAALGKDTIEGLAKGMEKSTFMIDRATKDIGRDAVQKMKQSLAEMSDILDADMDLHPTITPVLDLSELHRTNEAGIQLRAGLSLDASYLKAQSASIKPPVDKEVDPSRTAEQTRSVVFNQYNTSPKALSSAEIYRQTNNQLSVKKGALTKNAAESA